MVPLRYTEKFDPILSLDRAPAPSTNVWFALDENCLVCKKWLLHSTVTGLTSPPFLFEDQNGEVTVECSIHFLHTQQF